MPQNETPIEDHFSALEQWLSQNKKTDLANSINWDGLKSEHAHLIPQLKAYQRLLKILPKKNHQLIMALLRANIHSAIQVASMPKQAFLTKYAHLFSTRKINVEDFYNNALAIKNRLLLKHLQQVS